MKQIKKETGSQNKRLASELLWKKSKTKHTPLLLEIFQWIKNKCGSLWGQEYPLLANLRETVYKISLTDYICTMTYESPTARKYLRFGFKIVFKRKLYSQKNHLFLRSEMPVWAIRGPVGKIIWKVLVFSLKKWENFYRLHRLP